MKSVENFPLIGLNSFKTEAFAKLYCCADNIEELQQILLKFPNEEKLILGEGCNTFFTKNFDGIVIHPRLKGIKIISETNNNIDIEVAAGENWDNWVAYSVNCGYSGLENLSLIPGSVGASPVQNIGAYGAEVKDTISMVKGIDIKTAEIVALDYKDCGFGYRSSIFKSEQRYIITSVVFRLNKYFEYIPKYKDLNQELEHFEKPNIEDVRNAVIKIREQKLPDEKDLPNAGSFFKNPVISPELANKLKEKYPTIPLYIQDDGYYKTAAAFLIDQAGYKNKRIGDVGTYANQPLVIVNYGTNDGNEIVSFMRNIQSVVWDRFDILLEPEVRIY